MSKRVKWCLRKLFSSCRSKRKDTLPAQRRLLRLPDEAFVPPPQQPQRRRRTRKPRVSSGSEEDDEFGLMEIEMERSYESSTNFSPQLESIREGATLSLSLSRRSRNKHRAKRGVLNGEEAPARLSAVLQRVVPCAVRESFAVVKSSDDPYEDFRRSMAEMIVEKEMVEEADLRELLRCFLSLNSDHHHAVIIAAFNHIYTTFFSPNPDDPSLLHMHAPIHP